MKIQSIGFEKIALLLLVSVPATLLTSAAWARPASSSATQILSSPSQVRVSPNAYEKIKVFQPGLGGPISDDPWKEKGEPKFHESPGFADFYRPQYQNQINPVIQPSAVKTFQQLGR